MFIYTNYNFTVGGHDGLYKSVGGSGRWDHDSMPMF